MTQGLQIHIRAFNTVYDNAHKAIQKYRIDKTR